MSMRGAVAIAECIPACISGSGGQDRKAETASNYLTNYSEFDLNQNLECRCGKGDKARCGMKNTQIQIFGKSPIEFMAFAWEREYTPYVDLHYRR